MVVWGLHADTSWLFGVQAEMGSLDQEVELGSNGVVGGHVRLSSLILGADGEGSCSSWW